MKNIILLVVLVVNQCTAQTYDEWFRQQKTQKKYLLEQIAALQSYIGYATKGYSITKKGLNIIGDIKHGDLKLHNVFFNSLSSVNPEIKKYSKVTAIISTQVSIANFIRNTLRNYKYSSNAELNYLRQVFNKVLNDCTENLDDLIAVITDGEIKMKDDERIMRIDKIYADMQDIQVFALSFGHSAKGLSLQRTKEVNDIEREKKLNGVK